MIREGRPEDAGFLAETVMQAIGDELCAGLGDGPENVPVVRKLFADLAAMPRSQYSYTNALIAEDADGVPIGAVIAYEGSRLHDLRPAFLHKANELLGWNVTPEEAEKWEDEANADEIYIDSLYVRPEYRNQGLATTLIEAIIEKFADSAKPYGLLVEPENRRARRLYEKLGFHQDGINRFCGVPMHHLTRKPT